MLTSDMVFHSVTETAVLIFQTFYAMTGRTQSPILAWLQLQRRRLGGLHRVVWKLPSRPGSSWWSISTSCLIRACFGRTA